MPGRGMFKAAAVRMKFDRALVDRLCRTNLIREEQILLSDTAFERPNIA
jgi:hypothetical protein